MGTKERREREKLQRRQQIIDAAEQCYREYGFDGSTMDNIAEKAELSKGTLYLYFENKQEIFWALGLQASNELAETLAQDLEQYPTGMAKLQAINDRVISFFQDNRDFLEIVRIMFQYMKGFVWENMDEAREADDRIMALMLDAVELGQRDGSIRKLADPQRFVMTGYVSLLSLMLFLLEFGDMLEKGYGVDPMELIDYNSYVYFNRFLAQ
jgi:AcrR family transcriptional regulator